MIVLDTGVLYAAADRRDADHQACTALLDAHPTSDLVLPAPVVTECAWLIQNRLGQATEHAFIASVAAGEFTVTDLTPADYQRCVELLATYHDLDLGLVDASVITIAERLDATQVATLDHRHFRVVRPRHVEAFELLP